MKKKIIPNENQWGFSVVELLVVVLIIFVLSTITIFYLSAHQKLYKPDDQALKIIDILQEARQRSLTQRETMRVDISKTKVWLIDENETSTVNDDQVLREMPLYADYEVVVDQPPPDISYNPPEFLPAASAQFTTSVHPESDPEKVCTLRFQSNGRVMNAGNSPTGNNSTVQSVTLHIWSPDETDTGKSKIARAITVLGTTGSVRFWEYLRESQETNKWIDSRRTSTYGTGQTGGNTNSNN